MADDLMDLVQASVAKDQELAAGWRMQQRAERDVQNNLLQQFVKLMRDHGVQAVAVYLRVSSENIDHYEGRISKKKVGQERRTRFRRVSEGWVLQQSYTRPRASHPDPGLVIDTSGRLFTTDSTGLFGTTSNGAGVITQTQRPDQLVWSEIVQYATGFGNSGSKVVGHYGVSHSGVQEDEFFDAGDNWHEVPLPYRELQALLVPAVRKHLGV